MSETASTIDMETVLERNEGVLVAEVDDELIMLDIDKGMYYGLDDIGSGIWELLAERQTVARLCERLQERYAVSAEMCREDLLPFLEDMHEIGLINVHSDGMA